MRNKTFGTFCSAANLNIFLVCFTEILLQSSFGSTLHFRVLFTQSMMKPGEIDFFSDRGSPQQRQAWLIWYFIYFGY